MGASVQFYGIASVMQAAENLNCACWGIFINGRLFSKYESTDMSSSMQLLQRNLETLEASNANAIYTLKFFELHKNEPVKINDRSICDAGSFNFKLIDQEEREQGLMRVNGYSNYVREMENRVKKLEEDLKATEPEPEPETIGSVMLNLLKNPSDLAIAVNVFRAALGMPIQNLGFLNGIRTGPSAETIGEEEKLQRLSNAIDNLEKHDPELVLSLEKLAKIANDNPDQFKILKSMLGK